MVLDRELGIYDKPRAIVLDHDALRVLQACGLEGEFFDSVSPHTGTDFIGVQGQLIKLFDPKAPPFEMGWHPNVMFIQPRLEEALARAMDRFPGIACHRGVNVTAIDQSGPMPIVEAIDGNGRPVSFQSQWVVGADGANSIVRRVANLSIEDLQFAEHWVVVDAWLVRETELPRKTTQYCQPERPATFVVGPQGLRRWEIKLLPNEDPNIYRDDKHILKLLSRFVDVDALDLWRSAVYRFQAAVAGQWRAGHLLIVGDAAHTMPPFLAQGLCAGIRDAANLAWKLAYVVRRGADPALMDSYEAERKPHVTEIIQHAKTFGLIIGELDPDKAAERDLDLERQLRDGTAPTERQAFIPPLRHGLIDGDAAGAGTMFVQPHIRTASGSARMDDICSSDFLIIASDPAMLSLVEPLAAAWRDLGGRLLLIGRSAPYDRYEALDETDGLAEAWLTRHNATAAIIRPDRYVYGAAADPDELARMIEQIVEALAPSSPSKPSHSKTGFFAA